MATNKIDGILFKTLVANGCQSLANDMARINALNVFPVPDGDTGTNMHMTIEGGVKALVGVENKNLGEVCKIASRAMTLSARGNSGVILSQFFKGFSLGVGEQEEIDVKGLVNAFDGGVKQAYKVVAKPTEGTILTVMRESTEVCKKEVANMTCVEDFFKVFIKEAHASLERTPDLLPVLKEAGVIDSGGAGYNKIIEGMIEALDGNILIAQEAYENNNKTVTRGSFGPDSELEYGYCTEFILQLQNSKVDIKNFDLKKITDFLETIGNSIVAFKDDDIVKVHVHTFTPGKVVNYCQQFGEYITFKMENMSVQHSELEEIPTEVIKKEHKKFAIVAVSSGDGISNSFKEMGADVIVSGGQTMNPSSNDFIEAFETLDAENIFVFPNNGNIIMAAKQAAEAYDKANVVVINSKSLAQCYSALTMLDYSSDDVNEIVDNFDMTISNVVTSEITFSIRDSVIDGVNIKKGDYIAIVDNHIVNSKSTKVEALMDMFSHVEDIKYKEVVTFIYGKDVLDSEKEQIHEFMKSTYPSIEYGEVDGLQDVYSFIVSIE